MTVTEAAYGLLRTRERTARVTNVELFFDLVYVFAVTQLSHYLLDHRNVAGALHATLLLAIVWLAWAYTAWVTNWLEPERIPVRLLLIGLALVSLVMSAALPTAFGRFGILVGGAYAVMQIGRTSFMVVVLRGQPLRANFQRILAWCLVSGVLAVAGGIVTGPARSWLWLAAVAVDLTGGLAGFWTPGFGRSATSDWTIEGNHLAERCQAFILIALGESIVLIGATLSRLLETSITWAEAAAFKFAVWRVIPWTRLGAVVVLGLLGLAVPALPALGLGLCAALVVLAVAALDYRAYRGK